MEFKELVKGVKIPVLGLGTWEIGGTYSSDNYHDKENIEALRYGIELGMTHIDTAEMYGAGHSEEVVGEAIEPFDRERIFITTKVHPNHLRRNDLIEAAKASLKRLKTDYIDLYLIHWHNPAVPLKETMQAMEFLVKEGITRFIGVSNFDVKLCKEAQSYLSEKIVANQVEFSLTEKEPEKELLPFCQKEKIMLIAYSPLGRGLLANKRIPLLEELSQKYNKTPAQIALNWLISKEQVIAIPKAANIKHLEENARAVGWKLSKEDMKRLDKLEI